MTSAVDKPRTIDAVDMSRSLINMEPHSWRGRGLRLQADQVPVVPPPQHPSEVVTYGMPAFVLADMRLLYALIENRVKAVSVCSRGSTSRK
jgi:hypothetical protein